MAGNVDMEIAGNSEIELSEDIDNVSVVNATV